MAKQAVFLDRDNTIIADPGYIHDPGLVALLPSAAEGIRLLNGAGFTIVVVTNQSGIARGLLSEEQLAAVHKRLRDVLREEGALIDAIYYCPYLDSPDATVERYRRDSELRKPKPGMLRLAADELGLTLAESWMVGDSGRDVLAGSRAGCRTILLQGGSDRAIDPPCKPHFVAASLHEAAEIILANTG